MKHTQKKLIDMVNLRTFVLLATYIENKMLYKSSFSQTTTSCLMQAHDLPSIQYAGSTP